jgi:hypothetical protein
MHDDEHQSLLGYSTLLGRRGSEGRCHSWCLATTNPALRPLPYHFAVLVLGWALTTVYGSLDELSDNVGSSTTGLGAFLVLGSLGAVLAGAMSPLLHRRCVGHVVVIAAELLCAFVFVELSSVTSRAMLLCVGLLVGATIVWVLDGCRRLLRLLRLQQQQKQQQPQRRIAGDQDEDDLALFSSWWSSLVWLQVSFSLGASLGVLVKAIDGLSLSTECAIVVILLAVSATQLTTMSNPEDLGYRAGNDGSDQRTHYYDTEKLNAAESRVNEVDLQARNPLSERTPPHYYVELLLGWSLMVVVSIPLGLTSLFTSYTSAFGAESSTIAYEQLVVFWLAVSASSALTAHDQVQCQHGQAATRATVLILLAATSCLVWLFFYEDATAPWIIFTLIGFFLGPVVGYILNLQSASTYSTETSSTISLLLSVAGSGCLVFLTCLVWHTDGDASTLIYFTFVSLLLAVPSLWLIPAVGYIFDDPAPV